MSIFLYLHFLFFLFMYECCTIVRIIVNFVYMLCRVTCMRVSVYGMFTCMTAVSSENLLAGLGKCHPGKGRGEGFRVHLAARALQVIILPRLCVRRLKHQPTRPHVIKLSWSTSRVDARRKSISYVSCYPFRRERIWMGHILCRFANEGPRIRSMRSSEKIYL